MRILTFVKRLAGLDEPALESEFYEEFVRLADSLGEVIVVTDDVRNGQRMGIKVDKVRTIRLKKLYGLSKIIAYCWAVFRNRKKIDLIYVRTFSPPESIALWFGRRILGIKAALLIPGTWLFEPPTIKNRLFRWIFGKALRAADKVILYSPLMLRELRRYFSFIEDKNIRYVHNGVDVKRFFPNPNRHSGKRALSLLYVGRVARRKGIVELIKAFRIVSTSFSDCKLILVGGYEAGYHERVLKEIDELGVGDKVELLGPVPNSDIPKVMQGSDVFVYFSVGGEGIPRAILEAMACGLPIVATDVAGTAEAVRDGVNGFVVRVGDVNGFADRVLELLRDGELRLRMGTESRRIAEEEFSYDVVIPKLAEELREAAR